MPEQSFTPAIPERPTRVINMGHAITTVVPAEFPPKPSTTMTLLQEAITFVADGKPVSPEFIAELKRMVTSVRERMDLASIVISHHYLNRYQRLCGAIEMVESVAFNPEQIKQMEPSDVVALLRIIYNEANMVQKIITGQIDQQPPASEPIISSTDPTRQKSQIEARDRVGSVPLQARQRVRNALQRALNGESDANAAIPAQLKNITPPDVPVTAPPKKARPMKVVASKPKPKP